MRAHDSGGHGTGVQSWPASKVAAAANGLDNERLAVVAVIKVIGVAAAIDTRLPCGRLQQASADRLVDFGIRESRGGFVRRPANCAALGHVMTRGRAGAAVNAGFRGLAHGSSSALHAKYVSFSQVAHRASHAADTVGHMQASHGSRNLFDCRCSTLRSDRALPGGVVSQRQVIKSDGAARQRDEHISGAELYRLISIGNLVQVSAGCAGLQGQRLAFVDSQTEEVGLEVHG